MDFSITFKGRQDSRDPKMVKIDMIFYHKNYTRVTRVTNISGAFKNWNDSIQSFKGTTSESLKKNQSLLELKEKYHTVAEQWDHFNPFLMEHFHPFIVTQFHRVFH